MPTAPRYGPYIHQADICRPKFACLLTNSWRRGGLNHPGTNFDRLEHQGSSTPSRLAFCVSASLNENSTAATRLWQFRRCSALAPQETRDRDLFPDAGHSERIGVVEGFDRDTTGRFDEEQAADHPFAVVGDEGPDITIVTPKREVSARNALCAS